MGELRLKPAPERKETPLDTTKLVPRRVRFPKLSESQVRKRAGMAFDKSLAVMLKDNFSKPPPEFDKFKSMAERMARAGKEADLDALIKRFPAGSTIRAYYEASGDSTEWVLKGGKIAFNLKKLQENVETSLADKKKSFLSQAIELFKQQTGNFDFNLAGLPLRKSPVDSFCKALYAQTGQSKSPNQLPFTVSYASAKQIINYKIDVVVEGP
ncbi:MAG: hypothetical protein AB1295_02615 [Candidatus Micrarchaeota archaeon]